MDILNKDMLIEGTLDLLLSGQCPRQRVLLLTLHHSGPRGSLQNFVGVLVRRPPLLPLNALGYHRPIVQAL